VNPCPAGGGGGGPARMSVTEECLASGWVPLPTAGNPPPAQDPCAVVKNAAKKMDSVYIKSKADSVLGTISDLATGLLEKGFPIYKKFRVNPNDVTDTIITTYRCGNVQAGTDSSILIQTVAGYLELLAATLHTHPPSGYSAHSAKDVYEMIETSLSDPHFEGTFVAAANGSQYAITITDPERAAAFLNTKNSFLNDENWKDTSAIGKAFISARKYYEKIYKSNPDKIHFAYEMAMAAVIKQFNIGISLSKKNASGNFKPLVVTTIIPDPNKPKKKVYQQDCI
jgi:hypothetical protein